MIIYVKSEIGKPFFVSLEKYKSINIDLVQSKNGFLIPTLIVDDESYMLDLFKNGMRELREGNSQMLSDMEYYGISETSEFTEEPLKLLQAIALKHLKVRVQKYIELRQNNEKEIQSGDSSA